MKKICLVSLLTVLLSFSVISLCHSNPILYDRVSQSSSWSAVNGPDKAIDGHDNTMSETDSRVVEKAWWKLDFSRVFEIESIYIYSLKGLAPFSFEFTNSGVVTSLTQGSCGTPSTYIFGSSSYFADSVAIKLLGNGILELCMVQINGYTPEPVPEPSTILLFGTATAGLLIIKLKRKNKV